MAKQMDANTTASNPEGLDEIVRLLDEAAVRLGEAQRLVARLRGGEDARPVRSSKELARIDKVGEVAYRHWKFIENQGSMTLGDSLAIRRQMYGENVRSTANLFGVKGSGALFHRMTPFGTARKDDQEVRMTEEGIRVAKLWCELHPGHEANELPNRK